MPLGGSDFYQYLRIMDYMNCAAFLEFFALSLLLLVFVFSTKKWKQTNSTGSGTTHRETPMKKPQNGERCRSGINGSTDVIIVGAGVAGSALAYALAKDGWQVHIIERDLAEPDRIIGEFLMPAGYLKLVELGLKDCVDGIDAQNLPGIVFYKDGKARQIPFPLKGYQPDVAGRGIHYGRFVQRLRQKAASLPLVRLEQGTVTSLLKENGTVKGVQYRTKDGEELIADAPLTIVCDGSFSNLRRFLSNPQIEIPSTFVGFVMQNCNFPFGNYGLMILTGHHPVYFYGIGTNEVRCFVDVPGQKVPSISNGEMAHYLKTVAAPLVPPDLRDAYISAIDKVKIRTSITKTMPAFSNPTPGAFIMGDAFNMRNPLTGEE